LLYKSQQQQQQMFLGPFVMFDISISRIAVFNSTDLHLFTDKDFLDSGNFIALPQNIPVVRKHAEIIYYNHSQSRDAGDE